MKRMIMAAALLAMTTGLAAQADVLEQILVKVNGDILTKTDLEARQVAVLRARGLDSFATDADLRKAIVEVTPQVIATAVDELLLVQRAKELGYRLTEENFRRIVDEIKTENKFESDEQLIEALRRQEGMTMSDFRRVMEQQMLISQVQQVEILNKVSITDIEAREYYDRHLEQFTEPATVTLREVLVAVPQSSQGVNVVQDEQARAKADTARERVAGGEDFARIAAELSDSPSKANGGLIGPIRLDELAPAVADVLASLQVGEVSIVTRVSGGYQILKLEARTEALPRPFEEVRETISNNVFSDRRLTEYDKYLGRLREQAIIEWKNEDLKLAYDQFMATRGSTRPGV